MFIDYGSVETIRFKLSLNEINVNTFRVLRDGLDDFSNHLTNDTEE